MTLNDIGNIVRNEWQQTPRIRPDMNLTLDEFTVMPNHFHAIIFIGQNQFNGQPDIIGEDSLQNNNKKKFSPQSKNLSSIIRGFKSSVTTQAQKINRNFAWQERFHDHIIRNHESYVFIRNYILNNPVNWTEDTFYTI